MSSKSNPPFIHVMQVDDLVVEKVRQFLLETKAFDSDYLIYFWRRELENRVPTPKQWASLHNQITNLLETSQS